jgi:hypothetical protein
MKHLTRLRYGTTLAVLAGLLGMAILLALSVGPSGLPIADVLSALVEASP